MKSMMDLPVGVDIQGNLIAPDLTTELLFGEIKGQTPESFGLAKGDKLADEIATAWGDAKAYWAAFQRAVSRLSEDDPATTVTREQWVVPLLRSLGYAPVYVAKAEVVEGQNYAISHRAEPGEHPPLIHIIGCRVHLEQRPPSGKPRLSAHALVQEYLNRTEHLWAVVTNGLRWRLLRDSTLMTRLTYIEFDLEQILNGENFAEFGLFYRLFHRSRLPESVDDADECLLEFYHQESLQQGGRVRDRLRDGVESALKSLGNGFLQHPQSQALREKLEAGTLTEVAYYRQLLMLIYRLLFLMVAESRNLLLSTEDPEKARIYREYYSIERLRALVERPSWRREGFQDLWQGLRATFQLFDENWRGQLLGLSPLDGDLFGSHTLADLDGCGIDNHDLMLAVRQLSLYEQKGQLRRVNYGALDVEELGSVYESLLEFQPNVNPVAGIWQFQLVIGSERKTTGSYYTPPELVAQLIKSALEPVIAAKLDPSKSLKAVAPVLQEQQEAALLSLKVCDPACGSGHFLLAAARRIGKELARVRTGEMQPGGEALRVAIRDVIQHCIYGVDLNPLAVDLCKVALWLEGFCKGLSLNFLDHRIKCGNSLVGVMDLEVLKDGIPDGAFNAVTGDEKALSAQLKKRNKQEQKQEGQLSLFGQIDFQVRQGAYASGVVALNNIPESTPEDYKAKQRRYKQLRQDAQWWQDFSACNLWTAAFFLPVTRENLGVIPTTETLQWLLREAEQREQRETDQGSLFALGETSKKTPFGLVQMVEAANRLAQEHRFFHWCLEFPDVFNSSPLPQGEGKGGFDCVLGNPPWERIKLQEKEFFASRDYEIATAQNKAARERLIKTLPERKPELATEWKRAKQNAENQGVFIRESGRFLLTARGDINTYAVFSELARNLIAGWGRSGIIVPTGIATDDTCKRFFGDLTQKQNLVSLYDFENKNIFTSVHRSFKFSLLITSKLQIKAAKFAFFLTQPKQVEQGDRIFELSPEDIALINPNTLTCPVFRGAKDAELTKKIYRRVPVLENENTGENPWGISFMSMFHMSNDSHLFKDEPGENLLPLYEAKMFHQFDHRWASYEEKEGGNGESGVGAVDVDLGKKLDPNCTVTPRYWVSRTEVENRLAGKWDKEYLLAYRAICRSTDERTSILCLLPKIAIGHKSPTIFLNVKNANLLACFFSNFNSLIFDFISRQKIGATDYSYFILKQLPVIPPDRYKPEDIEFISKRVLELTYTAWDMKPFAEDMGYHGEPFIWNPERRALLRAELDAYYAHLYGLRRDELRYILDPADVYGPDFPSETFRVLKNNEIKQFGEYRTQRLTLEAWDRLGF